jgi:hypothetical protein
MASSLIIVQCSNCGQALQVKAEFAGKQIRCSQCRAAVLVPALESGAADAASACPARERRWFWIAAIAFAVVLVLCPLALRLRRVVSRPGPDMGEVYFDFRGGLRPEALEMYGDMDESFLKAEAEGLRVTLPKERTQNEPWGFSLPVSIAGDFEVTAAIELLDVEEPPPQARSYGLGVLMSLNQAVRIGRLTRANGVQVVTWDRWANVDGQRKFLSGAAACEARTLRLRLKRRVTTVACLWAPETVGENFQEFYRCDFGAEAIHNLRLEFNARQREGGPPIALDFRLIDLRIRTALPKNL